MSAHSTSLRAPAAAAFEDWLEALCRLSVLKALPTDAEIEAAGCDNCGTYLLRLEADEPDMYGLMLRERSASWGDLPGENDQPVARCVEHVIHMILVRVQGGASRDESKGWECTEKQVAKSMH